MLTGQRPITTNNILDMARMQREGEDGAARRALEAAEGRYGGEFLEEDPYEDWAVGLREEAQAAYISVTRLLADAAAGAGDRPPRGGSAHERNVGAVLGCADQCDRCRHRIARGMRSAGVAGWRGEAAPSRASLLGRARARRFVLV